MATRNVTSNGKAPANSKIGDTIKTQGGDYKIVSAGTKGATLNPATGNYSIKVGNTPTTPAPTVNKQNPTTSTNNIKTNTSYNGDFLTVDTSTDYQSKIDAAKAKGDYATAAREEANRNAKLNYLGRGDEATSNYTQVYTQSNGSGGAGTNNQGGVVYDNKVNTLSSLPTDWTTANVNGATYKKNGNEIFQATGADNNGTTYTLVGNAINPNTGEFSYNNATSANDAAYNQYIASGGDKGVSKEYAMNNLVDKKYVDSLLKGTTAQYTNQVLKDHQAEAEAAQAAALAAKRYGSTDDSFESDNDIITTPDVVVEDPALSPTLDVTTDDAYMKYIRQLMTGGRTHIK